MSGAPNQHALTEANSFHIPVFCSLRNLLSKGSRDSRNRKAVRYLEVKWNSTISTAGQACKTQGLICSSSKADPYSSGTAYMQRVTQTRKLQNFKYSCFPKM